MANFNGRDTKVLDNWCKFEKDKNKSELLLSVLKKQDFYENPMTNDKINRVGPIISVHGDVKLKNIHLNLNLYKCRRIRRLGDLLELLLNLSSALRKYQQLNTYEATQMANRKLDQPICRSYGMPRVNGWNRARYIDYKICQLISLTNSYTREMILSCNRNTRNKPGTLSGFDAALFHIPIIESNLLTQVLTPWVRVNVKCSVWLSGIFIFLFQFINFMFRNSIYKFC